MPVQTSCGSPAAGRENVTVNWQVSRAGELDRVQAPAPPRAHATATRRPGRDGVHRRAGSGRRKMWVAAHGFQPACAPLDRPARSAARVGECIGDHRSPRDDHLDRPRRADSTATRRSAAARARRWLCRPGQWRSSPRLVHTQPVFRDQAMDDDNGNPAPAAELAPNRNAQRSPAPPSQALAKLHPADGEAAVASVQQSIEQLPSTVRALELRDGLRASLGLSGAADRNWSAERCPSVGVCLQPPSFQVFSASAVVAFGPWSLDSRVDVCGSPRGFRHRTEAVVHRALLSRRARAEFHGCTADTGAHQQTRSRPQFGFRGFSADSDLSRPVHCFRPAVHCLARSG